MFASKFDRIEGFEKCTKQTKTRTKSLFTFSCKKKLFSPEQERKKFRLLLMSFTSQPVFIISMELLNNYLRCQFFPFLF